MKVLVALLLTTVCAAAQELKSIPTQSITQMPFEHPAWEPDDATKTRALKRAYELNGNSMVGDRMIDPDTDPAASATHIVKTDKVTVPPVLPVANAEDLNDIDKQADWKAKRKFMNRTLRAEAKETDVCARHGMRKVTTQGGKSWRCH